MLILLFLFSILAALINIVWYCCRYGIGPTATSKKVQKAICSILPDLSPNALIVDLGSGWGHLTLKLGQFYPNNNIVGYEISPIPFYASKLVLFVFQNKKVNFIRKNFFTIPLTNASLITCYLYPGAMIRLKSKFMQELKPGTYVVSHTFAIPGWKPLRIFYASDLYKTPIYLYTFPAAEQND